MTAPARFRQADLMRAIKAYEKAGKRVGKVEIDPSGKIVIHTESPAANDDGRSDWD